jgi:hypothetical protein
MRHLVIPELLVALVAASAATHAPTGFMHGEEPLATAMQEKRTPQLLAHGHVVGLYPGARETLQVRVENRSTRPLVLRKLRTEVRDASDSCSERNLQTRSIRPFVTIPARGRKRVAVPIAMALNAEESCQNARFPLRFHLRSVRK